MGLKPRNLFSLIHCLNLFVQNQRWGNILRDHLSTTCREGFFHFLLFFVQILFLPGWYMYFLANKVYTWYTYMGDISLLVCVGKKLEQTPFFMNCNDIWFTWSTLHAEFPKIFLRASWSTFYRVLCPDV